jgi:hypothetical protein
MPPYTNTGGLNDNIGSGNPYAGSGFTNFDRYLQGANIQWGASQEAPRKDGDTYTGGQQFDNWMIDVGHPQGFPEDIPNPDVPPQEPPPGPITIDNGPRLNPIDVPPEIPGPTFTGGTQPNTGGYTQNPDGTWSPSGSGSQAPPPVPTFNQSRASITSPPSQAKAASAFPALDKKLQSGVW